MQSTREQIILTTSDLLENQGYHGTGINQIVSESGAPKGSIYYHFPEGKDEIVSEAVRFASGMVVKRISEHLARVADPAAALQTFVETIAHYIEVSGFQAGGPLTIVASETATTNERLNQVCREAYQGMRAAFAERLHQAGLAQAEAADLAWTITAALEGAIILSRTYHSGDPLRKTARSLAALVRTAFIQ